MYTHTHIFVYVYIFTDPGHAPAIVRSALASGRHGKACDTSACEIDVAVDMLAS